MADSVIVVGGGIVGAAISVELASQGHDVVLLDAPRSEMAASEGNAGWVAVSEFTPLASLATLARAPKWLVDPDGPLSIAPAHLAGLMPWMARFLHSCRPARFVRTTRALAALCARAAQDHHRLVQQIGARDLLQRCPSLRLYRSEGDLEAALPDWNVKQSEHGVNYSRLAEEELRHLVPQLGPQYRCAVRIEEHYLYRDPPVLLKRAHEALDDLGGERRSARVSSLDVGRDGRPVVHLETGATMVADQLVLSAGAWSSRLAQQLGDRIPLESERGYHIELPHQEKFAPCSMQDVRNAIAVTPMDGRLRIATGVEFAGLNAPPDQRRYQRLARMATSMFPDADTSSARFWMGHRPSTPDCLPVIGRSPAVPSVVHAFGHGHLGLTLSATTARLVANLVAGRPAWDSMGIEVHSVFHELRPERFRTWSQLLG